MRDFWEIAFTVAGLGAVVSFVLWSLYKQWLSLPIFQRMTKKQQFSLFRLTIILTFVFAVVGLVVYGYLERNKSTQEAGREPMLVLVDSFSRSSVLEGLNSELEDIGLNVWFPVKQNWIAVANAIIALPLSTHFEDRF